MTGAISSALFALLSVASGKAQHCRISLSASFQVGGFLQVQREVEDDLNRFRRLTILIEAINVRFELLAVTKDLMATLLEGPSHVIGRCRANIVPENELLTFIVRIRSCMLGPNAPALRVGNILVSKRS